MNAITTRTARRSWGKTELVREALIGMAKQLGPGQRLPTVAELCGSLRVSVATLDRVLSELEADRILDCQRGRGIFVSRWVDQKTIGLVFGADWTTPFFLRVAVAAQRLVREREHRFRFYFDVPHHTAGADSHDELAEDLAAGRLDGVLLVAPIYQDQITFFCSRHVPAVTLSSTPLGQWRVTTDYAALIRLAVRELARRGCQRVGLITSFAVPPAATQPEWDAFTAALADAGLSPDPTWRWEFGGPVAQFVGESNAELGYRAVKELLGRPATGAVGFDGLVSTDDQVTRGALVALRKAGLVVGREVQVATHANKGLPVSDLEDAALIRVEFDPDEMVRSMYAMLEILMTNREPAQHLVAIQPTVRHGE